MSPSTGISTVGVLDEETQGATSTGLTATDQDPYALLDDGLTNDEWHDWTVAVDALDAETLRVLATDLLRERSDPSERVLGIVDGMNDVVLTDFVLFLAALNNDLSLSRLSGNPLGDPLNDPTGGGTTAMMGGGSGITLMDAVVTPTAFSRSEGGSGSIWGTLFAPMMFESPGLYSVGLSVDGDPAGISVVGPII